MTRWLPVLLVVTMFGAPLAIDLCQVSCATVEATDAAVAQHSCHDTDAAPPTDEAGAVLQSPPHACGHDEELPASAAAVAPGGCEHGPLALAAGHVGLIAPVAIACSTGPDTGALPPDFHVRSIVSLRI